MDQIKDLELFRGLIKKIQDGRESNNTRQKIYNLMPSVRKSMVDACTLKTMEISPPPAIGGFSHKINPLDTMFNAPFGLSYEIREHVLDMVDETIGQLKSQGMSDKKTDTRDVWMMMHPKISAVAAKLFNSDFYAEAVEAAFKEINSCIKIMFVAKGKAEMDGATLMLNAFSQKNSNTPVLRLNELRSQTERDIQDGYMHMFAGAMLGIRNPKAHANETITKEDALRKLAFASMLMYKLDEVKS